MRPDDRQCLKQVLDWSQERDFRGFSKHDALNSRILESVTLNRRLPRLLVTQAIMRAPLNLRPMLGVPRLRNPKGVALFAHAAFNLAEQSDDVERLELIGLATHLLSWLIQHASPWTTCPSDLLDQFEAVDPCGYQKKGPVSPCLNGLGWGYQYPWQDVGFFQKRHFPNRVVSSWIGFAFIRGYEVSGESRFLDAAREITRFILENPKRLVDDSDQLCLSYVPTDDIDIAVLDVSVLAAALCARVGSFDNDREMLNTAHRLTRFVVDKQTKDGAWFYTWPEGDSHRKHDNYHTAIILDCLADVMDYSREDRYLTAYRMGIEFYRRHLFLENGAPKWTHAKKTPHDIHGCASGILCFRRASMFEDARAQHDLASQHDKQATRIRNWTLDHLYAPEGYFYYQKNLLFTKRFNLMRWGNAWMCRALSQPSKGNHA